MLQEIPGAADVKAEQTIGLPMLRIRIDRQAIARYGINAADVLDVVETIGGRELGVVLEGQKRFVLQARFGDEVRADLERLRDLRVVAPAEAGAAPRSDSPGPTRRYSRIEDGPGTDQPRPHQPADQRRGQRPRP